MASNDHIAAMFANMQNATDDSKQKVTKQDYDQVNKEQDKKQQDKSTDDQYSKNEKNNDEPAKSKPSKNPEHKTPTHLAQEKVLGKELERFLNESNVDGTGFFDNNSMEYLNGDMTVKRYPDFLKDVPYLPDLEPIIRKYIASQDNDPNSFHMQMETMMKHGNNRHDFSLMVPEYIQYGIRRIAQIINSKNDKHYKSLMAFEKKFGDRYITNSNLVYAMLCGQFTPDHNLKVDVFQSFLNNSKKDVKRILKPLILNHTISPRNYKFVGKDTTTFNFPSNFGVVVSLGMIENLKDSKMLDTEHLKASAHDDSLVSPNSKSFGNTTIYQRLKQMQNLRMLINTKLQHVLFDGLKRTEF